MSKASPPSRHTNKNKSVNSATARNRASEETARSRKINRAVAEFVEAHTDRANVPVATEHGTEVRRAFADIDREEWVEDQPDEPRFEAVEAARGTEVTDVTAVDWADAVRVFAQAHAETEETTVNLEFSTPTGPTLDRFSFPAENRWMASYQETYYAQLEGWLRELTGGSRPSGGDTAAAFDNPRVVLLTRSASSKPGGDRVGPVDHAQRLRDAWEPTYHTLRNTMRSLGFDLGEDWQYVRRMEPHKSERGGGVNAGYAHEHTIVVVDGDVAESDLLPVVEKHVEACNGARPSAHGEGAIEIRDPDDVNDVGAYIADYCSVERTELWDRSPDYIGWAAAMTAGNVRVMSRSEAAREAAQADACRQQAESPESGQEAAHAEDVCRAGDGTVVCAECGSSHGVEAETLTAARTSEPTAADGGSEPAPQYAYSDEERRVAWPEADAAAAVGEPLDEPERRDRVRRSREGLPPDASVARIAGEVVMSSSEVRRHLDVIEEGRDPEEVRGFDVTVPKWSVESVTVAGEERPASGGNGVDMVAVREPVEQIVSSLGEGRYRCDCGTAAYGRDMAAHLRTHGIEEPERATEVVSRE